MYIYAFYIYAFSRHFYPKRLTLHSSYSFTFDQLLLSLGIEPMILALLAPCSTIWATGKPVAVINNKCIKTSFACLPVCSFHLRGLNQKHRTRPVLSIIVFLKQASQNLKQLMLRLYHTFVSSSVASIFIWVVNQIRHNRQQLTCQCRCHPLGTSRCSVFMNKQLGVLTWPLSVACGTVNISCLSNWWLWATGIK